MNDEEKNTPVIRVDQRTNLDPKRKARVQEVDTNGDGVIDRVLLPSSISLQSNLLCGRIVCAQPTASLSSRTNASFASADGDAASYLITQPDRIKQLQTQRPSQGPASAPPSHPSADPSVPSQAPPGGALSGVMPEDPSTAAERKAGGPSVPSTRKMRVDVPPGVPPGGEFQVRLGKGYIKVQVPIDYVAGAPLLIHLPRRRSPAEIAEKRRLKLLRKERAERSFFASIPPGVSPGENFAVSVHGRGVLVACPEDAKPGEKVTIFAGTTEPASDAPTATEDLMFEVVVPNNVRPGQPFALIANGRRVVVNCPPTGKGGEKIVFTLPKSVLEGGKKTGAMMTFNKDGWTRTIRISDMHFQWVRAEEGTDGSGAVNAQSSEKFEFNKDLVAYVRKIVITGTENDNVPKGKVTLIPAREATCPSFMGIKGDAKALSYSDLVLAQGMPFEEKCEWFKTACQRLRIEYYDGHIQIRIRRADILEDSVAAIMSLNPSEMRRIWKFIFIGEEGLDAGGVGKDWFSNIGERLFDPNFGLWMTSKDTSNQSMMHINPMSGELQSGYDLMYFRFVGRILGKALFDGKIMPHHMVRHCYKHLLGWPVSFSDIELVDNQVFKSMNQILDLKKEEVEYVGVDFTVTEESLMQGNKLIELKPGGADIDLTGDNRDEFVDLRMRHALFNTTEGQMTELVLGFFDVIPEPLLTVFDFQELELLMCGLSTFDMDDWMDNTQYMGLFHDEGPHHPCVEWFWEIVIDFTPELKSRLLQFVVGTSGVPAGGFGNLNADEQGRISYFTLNGRSRADQMYPTSYTCFNRLNLPLYDTKAEMLKMLKLCIQMENVGFDME